MEDQNEGRGASKKDLLLTKEIPLWRSVGMTKEEYRKLVADEGTNRSSLKKMITEYLNYFDNVGRINEMTEVVRERKYFDSEVLAGLKSPPDMEPEEGEGDDEERMLGEWFDVDKLRRLVKGSEELLEGKINRETISCARALCAGFFDDAVEVKEEKRRLLEEIENGEISFDDSEEDEKRRLVEDTRRVIKEQDEFVEIALMADAFVSKESAKFLTA